MGTRAHGSRITRVMRERPGFRPGDKTLVPHLHRNRPAVQGFIRKIPAHFFCQCIHRCSNQLLIIGIFSKRRFTGYRFHTIPFFDLAPVNTGCNILQGNRRTPESCDQHLDIAALQDPGWS